MKFILAVLGRAVVFRDVTFTSRRKEPLSEMVVRSANKVPLGPRLSEDAEVGEERSEARL